MCVCVHVAPLTAHHHHHHHHHHQFLLHVFLLFHVHRHHSVLLSHVDSNADAVSVRLVREHAYVRDSLTHIYVCTHVPAILDLFVCCVCVCLAKWEDMLRRHKCSHCGDGTYWLFRSCIICHALANGQNPNSSHAWGRHPDELFKLHGGDARLRVNNERCN